MTLLSFIGGKIRNIYKLFMLVGCMANRDLIKKDVQKNIAAHVFLYAQGSLPLIEGLLSSNPDYFKDLVGAADDPNMFCARFLAGAGISMAGALMKASNDFTVIEDICNEDSLKATKSGWYSVLRHPVYVSQRIMSLGLLAMFPTPGAAVACATYLGLTELLARSEERTCVAKFGEDYLNYMNKVPRWIPRPLVSAYKKVKSLVQS